MSDVRHGCFDIDLEGLFATMTRRDGWRLQLILELIQNCWDERGVKRAEVILRRISDELVEIAVTDDSPNGFANLRDAYTLFAKSTKVDNPEARGVFNLGEKLVISACRGGASIKTTTGSVVFDVEKNTRTETGDCTERGSVFTGILPMNPEEQEEVELELTAIFPPKRIKTLINGIEVPYRKPRAKLPVKALPVLLWDDEQKGLRERKRNTTIGVHDPAPDEVPSLYVMGLPVVELPGGDRYHIDVGHRIPVDLERQSVRPGILRRLRAHVLNKFVDELEAEDATETWAQESMAAKETKPEVALRMLQIQHGTKKLASHNPRDPEASKRFQAAGGIVLYGNQVKSDVWTKLKDEGLIESASVLTPSHRVDVSPEGEDVTVPMEKWTKGMHLICAYTEVLGEALLGKPIQARVINDSDGNYDACYGIDYHRLSFNLARLGRRWFTRAATSPGVNELLIHELAHEKVSDHLSDDFSDECCRLGAKLLRLSLDRPELWAEDALWRDEALARAATT